MANKYEKDLTAKSSPVVTDYLRLVGGSDNVSYKSLVSDVAKAIVENYTGSSIAGSSQSLKSAVDKLDSKVVYSGFNWRAGDWNGGNNNIRISVDDWYPVSARTYYFRRNENSSADIFWLVFSTDKTNGTAIITMNRNAYSEFTISEAGFIKPILGKFNGSSSWTNVTILDACSSDLQIGSV